MVDRGIADRDAVFEDVQGTGDGVGAVVIAGPEQDAAVGPHRKCTVGRAAVDQPEQGHQPGPSHLPVEQAVGAALVAGGFFEQFVQRPHAVGLGINRDH